MSNLLKHEFFKMFRSRYFVVICCIIASMIVLFNVASILVYTMTDNASELFKLDWTKYAVGILAMFAPGANNENMSGVGGAMSGISTIMVVLVTIIACSVIITDQRLGVTRNMVMSGHSRSNIYIAKYIAIAALTVGVYIVLVLLSMMSNLVLVGFSKNNEQIGKFFFLIFLNILLYLSLSAMAMFFASITNNTAATIGIIVGSMFILTIIGGIVMMLLDVGLSEKWDIFNIISGLHVANLFVHAGAFYPTKDLGLIMILTVGLITLVATLCGSILLFRKRGLK